MLSKLVKENKVEPCIVVGIWNVGEERLTDYFPGKIFERINPEVRQQFMSRFGNGKTANGDNYLKFIVEELKPYIDRHYSTLPGKENNLAMGSSMGALISMYAVTEYPEIFGGAG